MSSQGEKLYSKIILGASTAPLKAIDDNICYELHGCFASSNKITFVDEAGNVLNTENTDRTNHIVFDYGETVPTNNDFKATLEVSDIEFSTRTLRPRDLFTHSNNIIKAIERSLYLVEGNKTYMLDMRDDTQFKAHFTTLPSQSDIVPFNDGFIGLSSNRNRIYHLTPDQEGSDENSINFHIDARHEDHEIIRIRPINQAPRRTILAFKRTSHPIDNQRSGTKRTPSKTRWVICPLISRTSVNS